MTAGIASLVFIPLLAIAIVHVMWAFGSHWPAADEAGLARTVTGFRDRATMPPRLMSLGVAVLVLTAGVWALLLSGDQPDALLIVGGIGLTLVFGMRGVAGYIPAWRTMTPEEPFATFDRKLYSPLCLGLGVGFALLTFLHAT